MFGAGTAAAFAFLLKPEFGTACYGTLALLIALRGYSQRSWPSVAKDILTAIPGVVLCGSVIAWMISIRAWSFMTQENILSWPSCYFMRTYARMWLETQKDFLRHPPRFMPPPGGRSRSGNRAGLLLLSMVEANGQNLDPYSRDGGLGLILYCSKSIMFVSPLPMPFRRNGLSPFFSRRIWFCTWVWAH